MKKIMEVKVPGYTLHGDYYLADKVITNVDWEEACKTKKEITLPNGKKVIAHILSKEELETIPEKERKCSNWYWTSSARGSGRHWIVYDSGDFGAYYVSSNDYYGGARLGFKNPFFLEEEQQG